MMIEKDENGIFFCYDAILALIPVIIILSTVANINMDVTEPHEEKVLFNLAQDTLDIMSARTEPNDTSILEQISYFRSKNKVVTANKIADSWLRSTVGQKKYRLVEVNYSNEEEICSSGEFKDANNVEVAVRCQGSNLYKLFLAD